MPLGLGYFHFAFTHALATVARLFRRLTWFLGTFRMFLDRSGSFASSLFVLLHLSEASWMYEMVTYVVHLICLRQPAAIGTARQILLGCQFVGYKLVNLVQLLLREASESYVQ